MNQWKQYYLEREATLSNKLERLRGQIERAWLAVRDLEERSERTSEHGAPPSGTVRAAQIAAAGAMAGRLEDQARRLQIGISALQAERDGE